MTDRVLPSSFRDPSGFLFYRGDKLYRQINQSYGDNYDLLMNSGLYQSLVEEGLLVEHEETEEAAVNADTAYKVIQPDRVSFISYPYEWSFSQFKEAALATIEIARRAVDFGMSLKDASGFNIQFVSGKPMLIDTLSFERYDEGSPWVAYGQFCRHFLAPLTLMVHRDIRLSQMLRTYIDGIPLDLASSLLPLSTKFRFSILTHIHFHAKSEARYADKAVDRSQKSFSKSAYLGLLDGLKSAIGMLDWKAGGTEWGDYYEDTNYTDEGFSRKSALIDEYLESTKPEVVWDLGANTGIFSRIASSRGIQTISFDIDPAAVEKNYLQIVRDDERNILPLLIDLSNPSPSTGWENMERSSFIERGPADMVFALALIHHLVISNNVPLSRLAGFFARICTSLIIEFIPKSDSQIQRLLRTRKDIFVDYTEAIFKAEFEKFFTIERSDKIPDSERTLYLMKKREQQ